MRTFRWAAAATAVLLAACADRQPLAPTTPQAPAPEPKLAALQCVVQVRDAAVTCAAPAPQADARALILGGQNTYVRVISSNVAYDSVTQVFSADLAVQNLLSQAIGTSDGVNADPAGIRVFFHQGPVVTSGTGTVTVANADGVGSFTAAGQPYFQYAGPLAQNATTPTKPWQWNVPKTVLTFAFVLYLDVQVQPKLVITEVMPHPATASEAAGEWIEVYNAGVGSVELNGMVIASGGDAGHTIAGSVVIPKGGYAVLAGSLDTTANGGVQAAYAWSGVSLGNDTTDWLALRTPSGVAVDSVTWGAAAGQTAQAPQTGVARQVTSAAANNLYMNGDSASWTYAVSLYGALHQRGTPGRANRLPIHATQVETAFGSSCVLDGAGQAWCWGFREGYVPLGGTTDVSPKRAIPVQQGSLVFTQLMPRGDCAIDTTAQPRCWESAATAPFALTNPPTGRLMTSLDGTDATHVCGVDAGGAAICWGSGRSGLVNGAGFAATGAVSEVGVGNGHVCELVSGEVYCLGKNAQAQYGDSTTVPKNGYTKTKLPAGVTVVQLVTAGESNCVLSSTGQAYCWGMNPYSLLGTNSAAYAVLTPEPVQQPAGVTFTTLRMSRVQSGSNPIVCGLTAAGQAYCWGDNHNGQLGDGTTFDRVLPAPVAQNGLVFSAIAPGELHTCALEVGTGQPYCWGRNVDGELGNGGIGSFSYTPVAAGR